MPDRVKTTFWGNAAERRADDSKGFDLESARLVAEQGDSQLFAATRDDPFDDSDRTVVCSITTFPAQNGIPESATTPCSPIDQFNRIGLVGATGNAPNITISGLLPDGVEQVKVRLLDGGELDAPVRGNGLLLKVDSGPAEVVFDGPEGPVRHDVTIPQ
jgi:hypothetical protein